MRTCIFFSGRETALLFYYHVALSVNLEHTETSWKEEKKKVVSHVHVLYMDTKSLGSINLCVRLLAYYRSSVQNKKWPGRFNQLVDFAIVKCLLIHH
jgi:hypothetical protein